MEIERTPDRETPEDVFEEASEPSGRSEGASEIVSGQVSIVGGQVGIVGGQVAIAGDIIFGDPTIPPTLYHCSSHGDVIAQDVVWKQDGHPYCPDCGAPLDK